MRYVRSFINFCNFYRRFIKVFFKIIKSFNVFIKKNTVFVWNSVCDIVFRKFKNKILKTSILCYFDWKKQCYLKINFSNIVNDEIFSQKQNDDLCYLIAFFFKNMSSIECNYEIYDEEHYAIIRSFKQWRFELKITNLSIKIFTDHKSLEYFMIIKKLIKRHIKWSEFFSQYNFVILYQFDAQNVKTDALILGSNDQLLKKIKNRFEHQIKTLLSLDNLKVQSIDIEKKDEEISEKLIFVEKISRANEKNEIC